MYKRQIFNKLEKWGYAQLDWCTSKNTYASRGGIIDIFPTLHKHPIRVELVGSSVVSMRVFNITTQESIKEIEEIKINQPLSKNKNSTEDKLRNIYSSTVKNLLYITSEYNENTVKTEGRFDLFCEQLSQKTLPVRLMNKKINDYVNRGERVFVFRGVKVERSLEKQINRCDMVFGENVKCLALGTVFLAPQAPHKNTKKISHRTLNKDQFQALVILSGGMCLFIRIMGWEFIAGWNSLPVETKTLRLITLVVQTYLFRLTNLKEYINT